MVNFARKDIMPFPRFLLEKMALQRGYNNTEIIGLPFQGYCRTAPFPQGAALGYGISPRWGWKNANESIPKLNDNKLPVFRR